MKKKTITYNFHTFIDLTSVISDGFSVLRACMEASRAGIAAANSVSHSYLIPWDSAAASFATASSAATT